MLKIQLDSATEHGMFRTKHEQQSSPAFCSWHCDQNPLFLSISCRVLIDCDKRFCQPRGQRALSVHAILPLRLAFRSSIARLAEDLLVGRCMKSPPRARARPRLQQVLHWPWLFATGGNRDEARVARRNRFHPSRKPCSGLPKISRLAKTDSFTDQDSIKPALLLNT